MSQIKPPDPLDFTKADTCWPDWKRRFERYRIAKKLFKEDEDIQISTLLYTMGNESSKYVFTQFALNEKEAKDYAFVLNKFDGHFRPERNIIHKRAMLHERSQQTKDDCIRDRLVIGVSDKGLSKRLQLKEKLTLAESVKMRYPKRDNHTHKESFKRGCSRCGLSYGSSYHAKNAKCNKCNKIGHYARCCKTKQLTEVSCRYTQGNKSSEEEFFIGTITDNKDDPRRWLVDLPINGHNMKFKIDSGADVSVMSLSSYENMYDAPALRPTSHRLKGVNGVLKCKGTFSSNTEYQGKVYMFDIYVTDSENNLLSRTMAEKMNLIKLNIQEWFQNKTVIGHANKVKAIVEMSATTSVHELQQIPGMINYIGMFIPNLATIMKPMNNLLKKDVQWLWGPAQEKSFADVKQALVNAMTLTFYDPQKPTTVSADATSFGFAAVILQEENNQLKPIAFASCTLLPAEGLYAQIEKECLASVWACEKFDRYLRGLQQFKLLADHKPLVPLINGSDLNSVPIRCQRLLMRMMRYNPKAQHLKKDSW
ncbi:Retrovirus-related Pol poly from transposon opus, partial [Paramuricea clavata]